MSGRDWADGKRLLWKDFAMRLVVSTFAAGQRRLSADKRARAVLVESPFLSISGLIRAAKCCSGSAMRALAKNRAAPEALAREHANILLVAEELEGQDKQSKQ
jgi:hypothetical protein